MTLKCGLNRWTSDKEVHSGEGPNEEAAYQDATQAADRAIANLRWYYRDDCPPDCDGGRLVKWSLSHRVPYTWPGWKNDQPWWFAAIELAYDVAILCLTRKGRDAVRLHAAPNADEYSMDPDLPAQDAPVEGRELPCESVLRLSFTTSLQNVGFGKNADEADRRAMAIVRARAQDMLKTRAMRYRCSSPCVTLLLMDDNEPQVIGRTINPWSSIAKVDPAATLFCLNINGDLGPIARKNLIDEGIIDAGTAAIFWPAGG